MKKFLLFLLFVLPSLMASATHLRGGHISVSRVGGLTSKTFSITITVYTDLDCTNCVLFGGELDVLNFGDGTSMTIPETPSNPISTPSVIAGVASFTVNHTYSDLGIYTISYAEPNRNEGVINMTNSVLTMFYVETLVNLTAEAQFQSTPVFLTPPIFSGKLGTSIDLSLGAVTNDTNILAYEFGVPYMDRNTSVDGYQFPENISINEFNGHLSWDGKFEGAEVQGEFAFNVKVHVLKRSGDDLIWVCTVSADIQIILKDNELNGMSSSSKVTLDENGRIYLAENESKSFKVFFETSEDPSTIELQAYSELADNASVFSFTSYDSLEDNIKVGVLTLTALASIDREKPYAIVVRGKDANVARDISFLFYTRDLQPETVITKTEDELSSLMLYPNPTASSINLLLPENYPATILIQDKTGKPVFSQVVVGKTQLDVSRLSDGLYICTVTAGARVKRMKFVKH